jgi:hypothetical protein
MSFTLPKTPHELRFLLQKASALPLPSRAASDIATSRPGATTDHIQTKLPPDNKTRNTQRFREFDLENRVFAITGGGRGLGLAMAEALMEAGAKGS